jgi:hypothetical protein
MSSSWLLKALAWDWCINPVCILFAFRDAQLLPFVTDNKEGLVALQALSNAEDRAVATSTRNLLRSLGGVAGVAISTAIQYGVTTSALSTVPSHLRDGLEHGQYRINETEASIYNDTVLDARMRGFNIVFATLLPFMVLCSAGSFFVKGTTLQGDADESAPRPAKSSNLKINPPLRV